MHNTEAEILRLLASNECKLQIDAGTKVTIYNSFLTIYSTKMITWQCKANIVRLILYIVRNCDCQVL